MEAAIGETFKARATATTAALKARVVRHSESTKATASVWRWKNPSSAASANQQQSGITCATAFPAAKLATVIKLSCVSTAMYAIFVFHSVRNN